MNRVSQVLLGSFDPCPNLEKHNTLLVLTCLLRINVQYLSSIIIRAAPQMYYMQIVMYNTYITRSQVKKLVAEKNNVSF